MDLDWIVMFHFRKDEISQLHMQLKPEFDGLEFHEHFIADLPQGHAVVSLHLNEQKSELNAGRFQSQAESLQLNLPLSSRNFSRFHIRLLVPCFQV